MLNDYAVSSRSRERSPAAKLRGRALAPGYTSDVDNIDERTWYEVFRSFADANVYQSWAYGAIIAGRRNLSHLVVRRGGEIVGIAQVRLARIPLTNIGIAYVLWGPLWSIKGQSKDSEVFRQVIRSLRNEYVFRRGLSLRLAPHIVDDGGETFSNILKDEGFTASDRKRSRTMLMDLGAALEDLRGGMRAHWKRELKVGEKNSLDIVLGTDDNLFAQFTSIYREMVARKRFIEPNDIDQFRVIQQMLPDALKMQILLCKSGDDVCAGAVCSVMGNSALYLFGATSNAGIKSRGSYVLQWKVVEELKRAAIPVYDLNGINPDTNPGTFKFKSDLAGANGADVHFLGTFDAQGGVLSRLCIEGWKSLKEKRRSFRLINWGIRALSASRS
jgi:lipid II:glycine glycyltransferase (peptidoglycan interpeptide bridge formation enzyme)